MNRDEAARAVAEALVRACEEPPEVAAEDAILAASIIDGTVTEVYAPPLSAGRAAVDALIAVGWGDLAAERERLAAEVERLRSLVAEYESAITWGTTCLNCSNLLDRCYEADAKREKAEAAIARVEAIDPADHATTSRDYGRGFAQAIREVRAALRGDQP